MKKILLSLSLVISGFAVFSQAVVSGVSPASIQGNYEYGLQAGSGSWPGETDDATWGTLSHNFNNPGEHVEAEIMLVEDGTPGTNPQGNPISQEGCSALNNNLTGKIAVVYRNTCEFGVKVKRAQDAGAIACIIVNREDAVIDMAGGVEGPNVTIPCVFIAKTDGANLIAAMAGGTVPVTVFIGNKLGINANDLGAVKGEFLISPFATQNTFLMNGFDLGIQVYNYGSSSQATATVQATIDGPSGNVYDETIVLPTMVTSDTVSIFNGNPLEFPSFDLGYGNYPVGDYTLTYTIDLGVTDDSDYDNVFTSTFSVTDDRLSLARNNSGEPTVNTYPSNTESEYQSCMFLQDPNASLVALKGVYFAAFTDTTINELEGAEIFVNVYQWNDTWTDINDPNITANNDFFTQLDLMAAETYYPSSDLENGLPQYVQFTTPIQFNDGQRYLVCNQTYDKNISFGYDNGNDYAGNLSIFAMPIAPIQVQQGTDPTTWFIAGWSGSPGNGIMLDLFDANLVSVNSESIVNGKAFPNPTNDNVRISIESTGNGSINVTDVAGKVALSQTITLVNGQTNIDMSTLDAGVYIFNVTLENGKSSQFNVVKN